MSFSFISIFSNRSEDAFTLIISSLFIKPILSPRSFSLRYDVSAFSSSGETIKRRASSRRRASTAPPHSSSLSLTLISSPRKGSFPLGIPREDDIRSLKAMSADGMLFSLFSRLSISSFILFISLSRASVSLMRLSLFSSSIFLSALTAPSASGVEFMLNM